MDLTLLLLSPSRTVKRLIISIQERPEIEWGNCGGGIRTHVTRLMRAGWSLSRPLRIIAGLPPAVFKSYLLCLSGFIVSTPTRGPYVLYHMPSVQLMGNFPHLNHTHPWWVQRIVTGVAYADLFDRLVLGLSPCWVTFSTSGPPPPSVVSLHCFPSYRLYFLIGF